MPDAPGQEDSDDTEERTPLPTPPNPPAPRRGRKRSASEEVRDVTFPVVMRGYDRHAVDSWRDQVAELVEWLEEATPRDAAVRRALDEVGQETASILQRAHESAEEITARSRSQAEGRLQRAEREAEITVRDADSRAERLEVDTQQIWRERTRLIEEMRQLADELLGVTDVAADLLDPPSKREADRAAENDVVEGESEQLDDEAPTQITTALTGSATSPTNGGAADDEVEDPDTVETQAAGEDRDRGPFGS